MGGTTHRRLTTAEAKRRLRERADHVGPRAWIRRRPYEALGLSFVLGMALASEPGLRRAMLRAFLSRD